MSIDNKASIYNDMSSFADMRRLAREDSGTALRQVAEQFEAIFMQMMLKSMRDASMGNSLFDSDQSKMYQEMFDNQLSLSLSKDNSNGLADILVKQLSGSITNKTVPENEIKPLEDFTHKTKQQHFIDTVRPYAEKAASKLGANADVLIAQAALETGWGQAVQRHQDGSSGFNLFNIKANKNWQGPTVSKFTVEFKGGIVQREHANFRAYTSMDESFNDYVNYLKSNPRYAQALNVANDPNNYIHALANSGYATDPKYANKVMAIMSHQITQDLSEPEKEGSK
ncbi:Flagellar protein FlgJ [peptidoglycan hydrolase] [hydrothermal vent metagenome]|uniref:Flagellar protein FlgJ [peptidoglycan hydrolase] n=1 Tax=hydrothermal vent metagenome TaxID=652676 RepID=A0A3B0ZQZ2_9ZZZZ